MSKKHFTTIASVLHQQIMFAESQEARHAVERVARDLASEFGRFNANFDRARFLIACGVES